MEFFLEVDEGVVRGGGEGDVAEDGADYVFTDFLGLLEAKQGKERQGEERAEDGTRTG